MTRAKKIASTQLMDWLEGKLPPAEAGRVAKAVDSDQELQEAVAWLRRFLALSASTTLVEPPADLRQAPTRLFEAYAEGRRPAGFWQTLVATLTSDSWQRLAPAGARQAGLPAAPRQLIYASAVADVALNIQAQPDGQRLGLVGQVFPLDETEPAAFTAQLLQREKEVALTAADDQGKFAFPPLPAGAYDLVISSERADILIPALELDG